MEETRVKFQQLLNHAKAEKEEQKTKYENEIKGLRVSIDVVQRFMGTTADTTDPDSADGKPKLAGIVVRELGAKIASQSRIIQNLNVQLDKQKKLAAETEKNLRQEHDKKLLELWERGKKEKKVLEKKVDDERKARVRQVENLQRTLGWERGMREKVLAEERRRWNTEKDELESKLEVLGGAEVRMIRLRAGLGMVGEEKDEREPRGDKDGDGDEKAKRGRELKRFNRADTIPVGGERQSSGSGSGSTIVGKKVDAAKKDVLKGIQWAMVGLPFAGTGGDDAANRSRRLRDVDIAAPSPDAVGASRGASPLSSRWWKPRPPRPQPLHPQAGHAKTIWAREDDPGRVRLVRGAAVGGGGIRRSSRSGGSRSPRARGGGSRSPGARTPGSRSPGARTPGSRSPGPGRGREAAAGARTPVGSTRTPRTPVTDTPRRWI